MGTGGPTAYEILGVHPSAPIDLISCCYWNLVKELQARRAGDPKMDMVLHHVMKAYAAVGDPLKRPEYDASIGHTEEPLSKRRFKPARRSGLGILSRKPKLHIEADPYEVMGLHANALPASVKDAYRIMKEQYLRLPAESRRREQLIRMLEESYAVLSDPEKRAQYDSEAARVEVPPPPAPQPEPVLIHDEEPEEVSEPQPEPVEAKAEPAPPALEAEPELQVETPTATAAAAREAVSATADAVAETKAARRRQLSSTPRGNDRPLNGPAEPGTIARATHGLGAMGASVLRMARAGNRAAHEEEPPPPPRQPVRRAPQPPVERPDVEAVLLNRLAASVEELATSVRELTSTVREPEQEPPNGAEPPGR